MFEFIDAAQNSESWFALRAGKLTSSKMGVIMANYGKAFSEPAKKYAVNIAVEQISGNPIPSGYSNAHMERGHLQEPIARAMYEDQADCFVSNGGFFQSAFVGCSPDGLVSDTGVIEIKSVIAPVHYNNVKRGGLDPAYKWQFYGNLKFTGRDWLDFVSYCSEFPEGKQLFTHRITPAGLEDEFKMIDLRIAEFKTLVDSVRDKILNSSYCTEAT